MVLLHPNCLFLYCRRDEILRHIRPGALKLVLYEGQPQPGAGDQIQHKAGGYMAD